MNETGRALRALSDKIADRFKYFINEKQLAEVLTAELLPLFNAGIAGAYAAAAKHKSRIYHKWQGQPLAYQILCDCGWKSAPLTEEDADSLEAWTRHILALAPADARQASQCHVCGDKTDLACSDCRINFATAVYVCKKSVCRDEHERKLSKTCVPRSRKNHECH